jgi:hypothetical protein
MEKEQITEQIIVADLLWHYNFFCEEHCVPFVSRDPIVEAKYVRKMKKSLKTVLEYYGVEVDKKE